MGTTNEVWRVALHLVVFHAALRLVLLLLSASGLFTYLAYGQIIVWQCMLYTPINLANKYYDVWHVTRAEIRRSVEGVWRGALKCGGGVECGGGRCGPLHTSFAVSTSTLQFGMLNIAKSVVRTTKIRNVLHTALHDDTKVYFTVYFDIISRSIWIRAAKTRVKKTLGVILGFLGFIIFPFIC